MLIIILYISWCFKYILYVFICKGELHLLRVEGETITYVFILIYRRQNKEIFKIRIWKIWYFCTGFRMFWSKGTKCNISLYLDIFDCMGLKLLNKIGSITKTLSFDFDFMFITFKLPVFFFSKWNSFIFQNLFLTFHLPIFQYESFLCQSRFFTLDSHYCIFFFFQRECISIHVGQAGCQGWKFLSCSHCRELCQ